MLESKGTGHLGQGTGRRTHVAHPCPVPWGSAPAGRSMCQQGLWVQAERSQPSSCFPDQRGSKEHIRSLWSEQGSLNSRKLSLGTSPFPHVLYSVLWFVRTRQGTHIQETPRGCAFLGLGGSVLSQESPETFSASQLRAQVISKPQGTEDSTL